MGIRSQIRTDIAARILAKWGPDGSEGHWFRKVQTRPMNPADTFSPQVWITDGGQRKSGNDSETNKSIELTIDIVLELDEHWDRTSGYDIWCDRIQEIVTSLYNWLPAYGVMRCDYVDDEPFPAIIGDKELAYWRVKFAVTYEHEVGVIGKD